MFQTNVVDKIKTHSVFNNFFSENRAFYERMWKTFIERGRLKMTIRRLCIACWFTKAKNTHTQYVTLFDFPLQQMLHESAPVLIKRALSVLLLLFTIALCVLFNFARNQVLYHYCA